MALKTKGELIAALIESLNDDGSTDDAIVLKNKNDETEKDLYEIEEVRDDEGILILVFDGPSVQDSGDEDS